MKCFNCNNLLSRKGNKYCSNKCQLKFQRDEYINRWKSGLEDGIRGRHQTSHIIRNYLFEKYSFSCLKCGWDKINEYTKKAPLEVNHIDGNYKNNHEDNLELLCPNCHSLTSTYKGANRGRGRPYRIRL